MSQLDTSMPAVLHSNLNQEWQTLQNNYEQYEKTVLTIKLLAVIFCAVGWLLAVPGSMALLIAVLWLQEGILKTYQSRLGVRLLKIESLLQQAAPHSSAFQLHTEWLANRPGSFGLIKEYVASALKPTVAFPYAVLLLAIVAHYFDISL